MRILEEWQNGLYGLIKSNGKNYQLGVERDHKNDRWSWLVRDCNGAIVNSGKCDKLMEIKQVVEIVKNSL